MVILPPKNLLNIRLLRIYTLATSERLHYITGVIFQTILGIEYEIVLIADQSIITSESLNNVPVLLYGFHIEGFISIPDDALLFESGIRSQNTNLSISTIPKITFNGKEFPAYSIDFDIFSACFYLVTQYQHYHSYAFDEHGRHMDPKEPHPYKELQSQPIAEIYANHLFSKLIILYPALHQKPKVFDYKITFDIDSPYLHKHKSAIIALGSMFKNLMRLKWSTVSTQVKVMLGAQDPNDVFDYILEKVYKNKILFFFLISRHSKHDGRHTYKTKAYTSLIKKIAVSGIDIGIHPSYTSYMDSEMIQKEISMLEKITERKICASRMHFLKYRLPETFAYLSQSGITDDYTICPIHHTGFKSYMIRPYKWFDLSTNSISDLTLHPTLVMDRTLQKYMQLQPEQAWVEIKNIIDITRSYNGIFTILFHNDSLSETDAWRGWKMVFENTISYLAHKNQ